MENQKNLDIHGEPRLLLRRCAKWYTSPMESTATLDRVFDPISQCLTPAVARKIVNLRADEALKKRMAELAEKANEGQLSSAERSEYDTYVRAIHFLTVLQSKARRLLKNSKA